MLEVRHHLAHKQEMFKSHLFFNKLHVQQDFSAGMAFVPILAFWVMVFQDILYMIPPQLKNVVLRRLANHHKHEDSGHDKWFLEDAAHLGITQIFNTQWLFSSNHRLTRILTYRIMVEVFKGKDYQKVLLILALESTGHVFFENTARFVQKKGQEDNFKYFSNYHLLVEMNHAVFEEELENSLDIISLTDEERKESIAMIERVYDAFYALFDHLAQSLTSKSADGKMNEAELLVA
jgi:predicted DNA-binding ArsR family transcriptional regulator